MKKKNIILLFAIVLLLISCTTTTTETRKSEESINDIVVSSNDEYTGLKRKVAIARFSNETDYAKGAFYDKENDPIGKQALDILSTKLAATNKFILLERVDADLINNEIETYLKDSSSIQKINADYLIIGSVTGYGRKTTGEVEVFSRTKRQIVEAVVNIRLVDVSTGQIIYSEDGRGEAETEATQVLGFGARAGFDSTLNDKAIETAISSLVDNIVKNCMNNPWHSYFLSENNGTYIIAGGPEQGLRKGIILDVCENNTKIVNPQNGMIIELPGEKIGKATIINSVSVSIGDGYSIVEIDKALEKSLDNYVLKESQI